VNRDYHSARTRLLRFQNPKITTFDVFEVSCQKT